MSHPDNQTADDTSQPADPADDQTSSRPNEPMSQETSPENSPVFPIVGIGASAGGLEALETFFDHMPADSGIAFVVIQHLDPTHKSMLLELIKRHTRMAVFQAENGRLIEPNSIYIIPPNRDMTIKQGRLYLIQPATAHSMNIDIFFRSLAKDQAERAICIILSGAGSDGTLGLKAIKEAGGLVIAQEPASAKYESMPGNAIATSLVDYILPPADIPPQLLKFIELAPFVAGTAAPGLLPKTPDALQQIFKVLRNQVGHDFSMYKKNTIGRRIERRMAVKQIEHIETYLQLLHQDPAEAQALFKEFLISVTNFFRDPEAFEILEKQVIPLLFKDRRYDQPIRMWVPGCATGEEAYCLAILLQEQMLDLKQEFRVQIFASDIDEEAIQKARQGIYPSSIAAELSQERLQRFFVELNGHYQVNEKTRKMIVYASQSIIKDPPFSKLDLVSCRNLLIYLEPELQKRVISLLYYALKPGGFLFLGTAETPVELNSSFTAIDRKWKIFQRPFKATRPQKTFDFVTPILSNHDPSSIELTKIRDTRAIVEKLVLERYVQSCIFINEQHQMLYNYGRIGKYLEPEIGQINPWNILRLVREELRIPLGTAIRQAITQKQEAVYEDLRLDIDDDSYTVTITVHPIQRPLSLQGLYLVLFEEQALSAVVSQKEKPPAADDWRDRHVSELEQKLETTKEYLQSTIQELESSNEEVKSTNEELQSANEELETTQEEAQSINEELVTLNSELQNKVDQLSWRNSDISNILTSIDVGIIFLDRKMHIRRFNQAATAVINLIETDVGRPIAHIVSKLAYNGWVEIAKTVFETLIPHEVEVQTDNDQWFLMRVRPYRTTDNAIEGVVMTFTNITEQKERFEAERILVKQMVDMMNRPLIVLDTGLRVKLANDAFYHLFKVNPEETAGQLIYQLGNQQWDIPELRQLLEEIIPRNKVFKNFEVEHNFPTVGHRKMRLNAHQINVSKKQGPLILLAIQDISTTEKSNDPETD